MKPRYDFLVVGAGFFGATFARQVTDAGKTCIVIDKNPHIAGTAYDKVIDGINVSQYGAHIFHTHVDEIWEFVNRFGTMENFINKPKVISGNKVYSFPINLMTLHQLWGVVTPADALKKLSEVRIPCDNPRNFEEWALSMVGKELYELFFYGYTKKQWGKEPRELPSSIIQRLPIRLTYEENYFTTKYQGVPKEGFTKLVKNMLEGIKVELNVDFFENRKYWEDAAKHIVYSGPVDKFFEYELGKLDYNTLRFEHKELKGDFQGNAVMNYVDEAVPFIRIIEHKHFQNPNQYRKHYSPSLNLDAEKTIISYDIPASFQEHPEPYYPIRDEINSKLYAKYQEFKRPMRNVTFGGRLGEYKYLDLDQTIASAMSKAEKLLR
jgi:UDP-galactopyranose mutase